MGQSFCYVTLSAYLCLRPRTQKNMTPRDMRKDLIDGELTHVGERPPVTPQLLTLMDHHITTDTPLPPMRFLFRIFSRPCFPRGELVAVAGKAKSGKTFFTSLLMTRAISFCTSDMHGLPIGRWDEAPLRVLWYDTEQSEQSTQEILRDRILRMSEGTWANNARAPDNPAPDMGAALHVFNVRRTPWNQRMALLAEGVAYYQPDLVVVDGVRDLVDDINNGVQAQEAVERLMQLASDVQCCIACVLHQNKGAEDRNLRGWLGTELTNKAFEVYCCEKLMPDRIISVEQTHSRKHDIGQILYFRVDDDGLPVVAETPAAQPAMKQAGERLPPLNQEYIVSHDDNTFDVDLRRLFYDVLKNGALYYTALQQAGMRLLNCHDSGFWNNLFSKARRQGFVQNIRNREGKSMWALPSAPEQREEALPF